MKNLFILITISTVFLSLSSLSMDNPNRPMDEAARDFYDTTQAMGDERNDLIRTLGQVALCLDRKNKLFDKLLAYAAPKLMQEINENKDSEEWKKFLHVKEPKDFESLLNDGVLDIVDGKLVVKK